MSSEGNSVSSAQNLVSSFCSHIIGRQELTELSPRNSVRAKKSLSSVFETVLSETVFGPFPNSRCEKSLKV